MRHLKRILWGGVCLICLIGFLILWSGDRRMIRQLPPQAAAERWETEGKAYAMASCLFPAGEGLPPGRIGEVYLSVENALTAGGVPSRDYPWYYAASCTMEARLSSGASACDAELIAVGGAYFQAHPLKVLSGWYFSENEVMHDRIVLDRNAAWDLFYSDDVAGQFLTLNGATYQVAAVVEEESGKYNELAAGDTRRAWVLWDSPGIDGMEVEFTCVEMVLPQPVKDFAVATMQNALGISAGGSQAVIDNSTRFSLKNRWNVLRSLTTRGVSDGTVAYPYWENAARLTENALALRLIPEAILLLIPGVSLLILLFWLNRRRTWGLHSIRTGAERLVDRRRQRAYHQRLEQAASAGLAAPETPDALQYDDETDDLEGE